MISMSNTTNFTAWLKELAGDDTQKVISQKSGINESTLSRQLSRGTFRPEMVIALCRGYNRSPVTGLIETGYLREWEAEGVGIPFALHNASNQQLLDEIMRRSDPEALYLFGDPTGEAIDYENVDAPVTNLDAHRLDTQEASCRRLAVTLGESPRVWDFYGDGRWVMIRSLYAEPGHAPFPDRAGGPMPSTMIEERFGVLQELPLEVVAQIEQESVGRRIGSAEILSTFHDSTKNPTRETAVGDLRTMHDGKAHDDALNATVFEFPGPESAPADTHLDYVAKRGTPEPEEGDDDYGDGA